MQLLEPSVCAMYLPFSALGIILVSLALESNYVPANEWISRGLLHNGVISVQGLPLRV